MAHKTPSTWRALATIALCIPLTLTLATPSAALAEKLLPSAPEASALEDEAPQAETAPEELPAEKDTASPEATPEASESAISADAPSPENEAATPESEAAAPAEQILASSEASAVAAAPAPEATNAEAAQPAATTPVARIGSATYTDLPSAIKAAKPGETITLLANVDMSDAGTQQLPDGSTLDLNGHTLSGKNSSVFYEGNSITIKNGTFDSKGGSYGLFVGDADTSQGILLQDLKVYGGINVFNAGVVTLRNIDVDARVGAPGNWSYYAVWCDVNAQVVIESGHYTSGGPAVLGLGTPTEGAPASTMEVRGGTFGSSCAQALVLKQSNNYLPTITGGTFTDPSQATPYIAQNHAAVDNGDKTGTVVPVTADETTTTPTPIDPQKELLVTPITPAQHDQVQAALSQTHIQEAITQQLKANGATEHKTWTANVVARDKQTKVEDHDNAYTFTLPYPSDFDKANYNSYDYRVFHVAQVKQADGSHASDYQVVDPSKIQIGPEGITISDSTLSPFIVSYVKKPAPTPEMIITPMDTQDPQVQAALAQPHIQETINQQLKDNGATQNEIWAVDVVVRDKYTKVEDHDNAHTFTIPYPSGIDAQNYESYDYRVFHVAQVKQADGSYVSDYQIVDPSKIEITPDGIKIYSTTLSPFIVSYVKKAAPAPHNQDSQDQKGQQENTQQTNTSKKSVPTQVTQTTPKQATHETPKLGDDDGLWPVFFALAMLVTFGIVDLAWRYHRQ